ncbi:response regulator transcription factor [Paraflavitalea speifideaquila]|uniref:response regulator transcription factor n=1 Tax=Paraflavitalea speifideaquila TaxID=3076558 RepID=UPI0028E58716|nr:response regulator transcription factor [Paraflavitalea speifideiaquila]
MNGYDLMLKMNSAKNLPEVVLLDINMPVVDGVCVAFYLSYHFPQVKIIALSTYDSLKMIVNIMHSGTVGYLLKTNMESLLDEAISQVLAGKVFLDPRIELDEQQLYNLVVKKHENSFKKGNAFGLTAREATFVILNATMLTYDQIAKIMFVETKTIQTYFDRVSKKLNLNSRQALTIYSIQNGLSKLAFYS